MKTHDARIKKTQGLAGPFRILSPGFSASGQSRLRLGEHRLKVAKSGVAHGLLQAWAGARRRSGELFKDSAEDHKRDATVVGRFGSARAWAARAGGGPQ